MEDNFEKPLYEDYSSHLKDRFYSPTRLKWREPVLSRGRFYSLADRPLINIGSMLIFMASLPIANFNPVSLLNTLHLIIGIIIILLGFLSSLLYERRFVYRYGRFRVTWENEQHQGEEASKCCDKNGGFLKTEENSIAARKSRRAFLVFYICLIAAVFLYLFLGMGLSYTRIYNWHRDEIEEAVKIAYKYDSLYVRAEGYGIEVSGEKKGGEDVSEQDAQRLKEIYASLQWDYVYAIGLVPDKSSERKMLRIDMYGGYLIRYEEKADISQVQIDYPGYAITQMDEHWWYVR